MKRISLNKKTTYVLDLGSYQGRLVDPAQELLAQEASRIVATQEGDVVLWGNDAAQVRSQPHDLIHKACVIDGLIADPVAVAGWLTKARQRRPRTILEDIAGSALTICTSLSTSAAHTKAWQTAAWQAGFSSVQYYPLLCGVVANQVSNNSSLYGLVIDVGAQKTDIGVVEGMQVIKKITVPYCGQYVHDRIQAYTRFQHHLDVSKEAVEELLKEYKGINNQTWSFVIRGKNRNDGMPVSHTIKSQELVGIFDDYIQKIGDAILSIIESLPLTLLDKITKQGLYLCGGFGQLEGLDGALSSLLQLKVVLVPRPQLAGVLGVSALLKR